MESSGAWHITACQTTYVLKCASQVWLPDHELHHSCNSQEQLLSTAACVHVTACLEAGMLAEKETTSPERLSRWRCAVPFMRAYLLSGMHQHSQQLATATAPETQVNNGLYPAAKA